MDLTIVIPIYNRPEYLRQTLDSLLPVITQNETIILSDDGSTDHGIIPVIEKFIEKANSRLINVDYYKNQHFGVHANMMYGIEECYTDAIITLDSDFVVAPDFLLRLWDAMGKYANDDTIITGFNAPAHKPIKYESGYVLKNTIGGGNLAFTWEAYKKHIKPALVNTLWDWAMSASVIRSKGRLICLTPSVCQHIGIESTLGHVGADVAMDFQTQTV